MLLGLKFEELSWDYAKPSQENNEDCLPCLFLQFCAIENGRRVSKILQEIFKFQHPVWLVFWITKLFEFLVNGFFLGGLLLLFACIYCVCNSGTYYGYSSHQGVHHFLIHYEFLVLFLRSIKLIISRNFSQL